MSWMDFKTAQALKAQKLATDARKQKNGEVQKGQFDSKPMITSQSISVKTATAAPRAARRVQGISKDARMTFAPGKAGPIQPSGMKPPVSKPAANYNTDARSSISQQNSTSSQQTLNKQSSSPGVSVPSSLSSVSIVPKDMHNEQTSYDSSSNYCDDPNTYNQQGAYRRRCL